MRTSELQDLLPGLNEKLWSVAVGEEPYEYYAIEGRNNYTAVDVFIEERCQRNLTTGTPYNCYVAMLEDIVRRIDVD